MDTESDFNFIFDHFLFFFCREFFEFLQGLMMFPRVFRDYFFQGSSGLLATLLNIWLKYDCVKKSDKSFWNFMLTSNLVSFLTEDWELLIRLIKCSNMIQFMKFVCHIFNIHLFASGCKSWSKNSEILLLQLLIELITGLSVLLGLWILGST